MRCLVGLTALRDQTYDPAYHAKLQGVLYDLLEESGYEFVHRERPFKYVTFSNVFPPSDMSKGDERTWIVASPSEDLIDAVSDTIQQRDSLTVGDRQYRVEYTSVFELTPSETGAMETGTPIVVRIPAGRCEEYGIPNEAEYDDVYWRFDHPREAFVDEIERNLAAKYRAYYDTTPPDRPYFTDLTPRKQVSVPIHYSEQEVTVIGTTWTLEYECRTRPMYDLIKMAYGAGVGELNTSGFGFVNETR